MNHSCEPRKLERTHARSHRQMEHGEEEEVEGGCVGLSEGRVGVCVYSQELEMAAVSEIDLIYSKT